MTNLPSYALKLSTRYFMPALKDENGRKYEWVPCQDDPQKWDDDPWISIAMNREAAEICRRECPALAACRQQRQEMEQIGGRPRGVWAGEVLRREPQATMTITVSVATAMLIVTGHPQRKRSNRLPPLPDSITVIDDGPMP